MPYLASLRHVPPFRHSTLFLTKGRGRKAGQRNKTVRSKPAPGGAAGAQSALRHSLHQTGEFEAAWPHIVELKSKGTPIILKRSRTSFSAATAKPASSSIVRRPERNPKAPIPAQNNPNVRWMGTNYIELVVDGDIVDLNRIRLPADTVNIDQRFDEGKAK